MMGRPAPPCSTMPPRSQGRPAAVAAARVASSPHDHVVVHVGDRPAPLGVGPDRQRPGHDGLEVGHQVPAHQRVVEAGQEQQARRLDGAGGHHHVAGADDALDPVGADDVHPGGPSPLEPDPGDEGLRPGARPGRWPWPAAAWPPGRPWRGWDSRRRRRSRSCCRPVGRRRERCWPRWAPDRGDSRGARPPRRTGGRRTSEPPRAWGRGPNADRRRGWRPRSRPPRSAAPPRRRRARARRSRAASRPRRRRAGDRAATAPGSPPGMNRGTLPSAWVPPPPTVDGTELNSPTWVWSPSAASARKVRGSTNGSGPRKCRVRNLISSLE